MAKTDRADLPLVRLNLVQPLVDELVHRRLDFRQALAAEGLTPASLDSAELFVPAPTMYRLVEHLSEVSSDPYFGVRVGEQLDPWSWSPLQDAAAQAGTIGEFLLRFSISANEDTTSCSYHLETTGRRTTFAERRVTDGGILPRQNDAFGVAYVLSVIRPTVGESWEGKRVTVSVSDPDAIPPLYLGIRKARGDTMGFSISFPSQWMLLKARMVHGRRTSVMPAPGNQPAASLVAALHQALEAHLHEPDLCAARVARLFGTSQRTLARRLQEHGTSLQLELTAMRCARAKRMLERTEQPVAGIAKEIGYAQTAVFSRAFRRWTGFTPSAYRKACRNRVESVDH